jgi:hypothetical protein
MDDECKPSFSSSWWKDLCSIGFNLDRNWFGEGVVKKMGNGVDTRFWDDAWVGNESLRVRFPRLFSISTQKLATIANLWNSNGMEGWNLMWRRRLFAWETTLMEEFLLLINSVRVTEEGDRWVWLGGEGDNFSVKSAYAKVSNLMLPREIVTSQQESAFKVIWNSLTPSKVFGFAWLVLRG